MPFPYQHHNGGICCSAVGHACDNCKAKLAAENLRNNHPEDSMEDYTPIDSYAPGIAKLRAAEATDLSRFAERYASERLRALGAEHTAIDARIAAAPQARLTAAEVAACEAPNGYQIALDKMRSEGR